MNQETYIDHVEPDRRLLLQIKAIASHTLRELIERGGPEGRQLAEEAYRDAVDSEASEQVLRAS